MRCHYSMIGTKIVMKLKHCEIGLMKMDVFYIVTHISHTFSLKLMIVRPFQAIDMLSHRDDFCLKLLIECRILFGRKLSNGGRTQKWHRNQVRLLMPFAIFNLYNSLLKTIKPYEWHSIWWPMILYRSIRPVCTARAQPQERMQFEWKAELAR